MVARKAKRLRDAQVLRGHPLNYPAAVSARYHARLDAAVARMTHDVEREITKLYSTKPFQQYFAMDASVSSQARILMAALMRRFEKMFADIAQPAAEEMVSGANAASSRDVRSSLFELSKGLMLDPKDVFTKEIREVMSAAVTENVGLIKSIASRYLDQVQSAVMRSITTGNGLADLVPFLEKQAGITKRKAKEIATDQVLKCYGSLNLIRMRKAGIRKFEWLHSFGGMHPRKQHLAWDKKIFSLDDLPVDNEIGQRTFPGFQISCKCRAVPVISFADDR